MKHTPSSTLPDSTSNCLDAALVYSRLALPIIPLHTVYADGACTCTQGRQCSSPGKHPRIKGWQNKATIDRDQILAWWDKSPRSNIGMVTGGTNRWIVIDIDGHTGRQALHQLEERFEPLPLTLTSQSGREDGGEHRIFIVPPHVDLHAISNSTSSLGKGLDVRAKGGQIVVAPSLHASGKRYRWVHKVPPVPLPAWLYERLVHKPQPKPTTLPLADIDGLHPYARKAIEDAVNQVQTAPEGKRNNTLNTQAHGLGKLIGSNTLSRDMVEQRLRQAALQVGLGEKEIEQTLCSGIEAGMSTPKQLDHMPQKSPPPRRTPSSRGGKEEKMTIVLQGDLDAQTQAITTALTVHNTNPPFLFRCGLKWIRINSASGRKVMEELNAPTLRAALQYRFRFVRIQKDGAQKVVDPSIALMTHLLGHEKNNLAKIERIIRSPVFIPSTAQLAKHNDYYPELMAWLDMGDFQTGKLPSLEEAKALIHELLLDFPFADQASYTHIITMGLTVLLRPLIQEQVPLFLISAPVPGTGKSLLVDCIHHVITGTPVAAISEARDDDEWRKRITSLLAASPSLVLLDNLNRQIRSSALASVLTAHEWSDRKLGQSQMMVIENQAVWVATANNPNTTAEIARRIVWIHMDPRVERPWTRTEFAHELPGWARQQRAPLLGAFITLVETWKKAGMPMGSKYMGSFGRWARLLSGICEVCGLEDFLANQELFWELNDSESQQWRAFIQAWWTSHQNIPVGITELYQVALKKQLFDLLGDGSERSQKCRLGKALTKQVDRVFSNYVIRRAGKLKTVAIYELRER